MNITQRRSVRSRRTSENYTPRMQLIADMFWFIRESEAEYLANLKDSLSAGTTWSRICETIDLENSQSKTIARTGAGTTDLSR